MGEGVRKLEIKENMDQGRTEKASNNLLFMTKHLDERPISDANGSRSRRRCVEQNKGVWRRRTIIVLR